MKSSLARIPPGTRVFVDANIFALYYSDKGPLGQACSLIVAVMQASKLRHLVTHDAGFDRVTGIQLWGPAW